MARLISSGLMGLLTTLVIVPSAQADNGALAYARPASGIVIDGDLSDWPASAQAYAVSQRLSGADWRDATRFHVAYAPDGSAIYVALVTQDAPAIISEEGPGDWQAQDAHILYVDPHHDPRGSGAWSFSASLEGFEAMDDRDRFDPRKTPAQDVDVAFAASEQGGQRVYEWRIALDMPMRAGQTIGLDHLVVDLDTEEDRTLAVWGAGGAKSRRAGRLGDVLLLAEDEALGQLTGQMAWGEGTDRQIAGERLTIWSQEDEALWLVAQSDEMGRYDVTLPAGRYCVTPNRPVFGGIGRTRIADGVVVCADVIAGEVGEAPDLIWAVQPSPDHLIAESGLLFEFGAAEAERLDRFMAAYMDQHVVPGVSLAIVDDGEIVYQRAYGQRSALTGEPLRDDHLFNAGSITKVVFAFAVHRLAERGVIDLDRPLHEYLPFEGLDDPRAELLTARMVLSHQTGLPNWRRGALAFRSEPGEGFSYSGEAFDYLGDVIAHLTGESLEAVMMREGLEPLGFGPDARFTQTGNWDELFVHGHFSGLPNAFRAPEEGHAAFGLHATAGDFGRMIETLIAREGGLSQAGYDAMLGIEVSTEDSWYGTGWPVYQGLGPRVTETPFGHAIGHAGGSGGNISLLEYYPDHSAGFIVLTNAQEGAMIYSELRRFLVAGQEHSVEEDG